MASPVSAPHTREEGLGPWLPVLVLLLMTLAFGAGFAWLSVLRHLAYQSHAFDLGNMDQAVWNALHGHGLRFTDMAVPPEGSVLTNRLAIHVEPILVLIAPLYVVHSGPETLLVLQALVVATGAVPAYLIARRWTGARWLSLVFPAAYLLHPSLQNAVLDDFHAVTLSAALLLWALYFLAIDRLPGFWLMALLAMATKEEIGLVVALLGILLLFRHRTTGVVAVVLGTAVFLIDVLVVIPHFNPGGQSPYLERYAYLGHGARGVIRGAIDHPGLVWHTLTSEPRLLYLDVLLRPLGYVPVLGLPLVLPLLPTLAINMLSAEPTMYSGFYQYSAETIPFLVAAAIGGTALAAHVARRQPRVRLALLALLSLLVLVASAAATRRYGFSPLAEGYVVPSAGEHQQLESSILDRIPRGAVVAAADEIEPHLSDRSTVYLLPTVHPPNGPPAEYLVLDASIPSLPVTPRMLHRTMRRALAGGYGVVAAKDGILLLRRGVPQKRLPAPFYRFALTHGPHVVSRAARLGSLSLTGVTVHPGYGWVNRSRPGIEVETYWRALTHPEPATRVIFLCSPVYAAHPPPLGRWTRSGDSPTLAWLPPRRWPVGRTIHVASLPCLPDTSKAGRVDIAVTVTGTGAPRASVVRLATVEVRP